MASISNYLSLHCRKKSKAQQLTEDCHLTLNADKARLLQQFALSNTYSLRSNLRISGSMSEDLEHFESKSLNKHCVSLTSSLELLLKNKHRLDICSCHHGESEPPLLHTGEKSSYHGI